MLFMLSQLIGDGSCRDLLDIEWYSLLMEERCWDHHGFERGDGHLVGACKISRVVSRVEEMSNYLARALGVVRAGQGGRENSRMSFLTEDQSIRAQWGVGGGSIIAGGWRVRVIGT